MLALAVMSAVLAVGATDDTGCTFKHFGGAIKKIAKACKKGDTDAVLEGKMYMICALPCAEVYLPQFKRCQKRFDRMFDIQGSGEFADRTSDGKASMMRVHGWRCLRDNPDQDWDVSYAAMFPEPPPRPQPKAHPVGMGHKQGKLQLRVTNELEVPITLVQVGNADAEKRVIEPGQKDVHIVDQGIRISVVHYKKEVIPAEPLPEYGEFGKRKPGYVRTSMNTGDREGYTFKDHTHKDDEGYRGQGFYVDQPKPTIKLSTVTLMKFLCVETDIDADMNSVQSVRVNKHTIPRAVEFKMFTHTAHQYFKPVYVLSQNQFFEEAIKGKLANGGANLKLEARFGDKFVTRDDEGSLLQTFTVLDEEVGEHHTIIFHTADQLEIDRAEAELRERPVTDEEILAENKRKHEEKVRLAVQAHEERRKEL